MVTVVMYRNDPVYGPPLRKQHRRPVRLPLPPHRHHRRRELRIRIWILRLPVLNRD
jgi:hypothetical protein